MIVPGALDRFVFGKLVVAVVGAALAFTVPVAGRLPRAARVLLASGCGIVVLASLVSDSPVVSLLGRAPRYEGVLVLAVYLLAGLAGVRLLGPGRADRVERVALAVMSWCVIAVGALAVVEAFGIHPLSSDLARPGSLLGNASDEGAFAVLYSGPLLVHAIRARRALVMVGAGAAVVTVVLSASRGALVGFLVVLLVAAVLVGARRRRVLFAIVVGAVALALAVPFSRDRLLGLSPLSGKTVTGRELLWRESLALLVRHPVLGVGPSQFENAIVGEHDLTWQQTIGPQNPPGSPHNLLLQVWSAGGVLLVVVLVWLAALVVRNAWRQVRVEAASRPATGRDRRNHHKGRPAGTWAVGGLAGLVGYAVTLQFHLTAPSTTIPACVLAGSLLAIPRPDSEPAGALAFSPIALVARVAHGDVARRAGRLVAAVCSGLLAVLFVLASVAEVYLLNAAGNLAASRYRQASTDFNTAYTLRPWDVDLPGKAMTQFVTVGTSGAPGAEEALPFATVWSKRLGPVADDEQLVQNRAALLLATGDLPGAATLLDRTLGIDPDNPALLLLRGVVYAQLGQYEPAVACLTHATRVTPNDPRPWHDLAYVYNAQGRQELATEAQRRAEQLSGR